MIAHYRPYRLLQVAVSIALVLPRYLWLIALARFGRIEPDQTAWDRAHAAAARQVGRLALTLAGAFTKVAQIGGARADVLPQPFIDELSQFHDAVPPRPFESLRALVEEDLGRGMDDVFARFDPEAMAAASLAQVHRAQLRDGRNVVVKIRYPEIGTIMPLDLSMLRAVANLARRLQKRVDLRSLAYEVARFVELELDFEREVRSMERLGKTLARCPGVRVPLAWPELCGPNTIVMEYLEGIQVTRVAEFEAAGHKPADVARRVGALYGRMIFEHGFFHGDPHPGNLLVLADGSIGLLDFGLCKELPDDFARHLAQMMVSGLIGDTQSALDAAAKLGFKLGAIEGDQLRSLFLMIVGDSDGDDTLLDLLSDNRIERIPEDFALVLRTLILLNGLSHRLAPNRRLIQAELLQHLAEGAARSAAA